MADEILTTAPEAEEITQESEMFKKWLIYLV